MYAKQEGNRVAICAVQLEGYVEVTSAPETSDYRDTWELVGTEIVERVADKAALQANEFKAAAQATRDQALSQLVHDFGDGRVIQTRPKDEGNIKGAIELLEATGQPSRNWFMNDNTVAQVTKAELETALSSGQLAAASIWDTFLTEMS